MDSGHPHEIVIEPNRSWLRIPWREVWEYRDLLRVMVQRDFTAKYKQTILGPVWFVIQPLITTLTFVVVFNRVANIPTDKLPPLLFYLSGTLAWSYFAQCLGGTSSTFVGNASLFGKVYFPRLVVPLSKVVSGLVAVAFQMATFLAFWGYFKWFTPAGSLFHMQPTVFLLPLLLVQSAALGLGVGLLMSALTAKYRDFGYVMGFATGLWMYVTPVVYPLSQVAEKWPSGLVLFTLNPMTSVVEGYRYLLLGTGTVGLGGTCWSVAITLAVLLCGIFMFNRTERTFIDTV